MPDNPKSTASNKVRSSAGASDPTAIMGDLGMDVSGKPKTESGPEDFAGDSPTENVSVVPVVEQAQPGDVTVESVGLDDGMARALAAGTHVTPLTPDVDPTRAPEMAVARATLAPATIEHARVNPTPGANLETLATAPEWPEKDDASALSLTATQIEFICDALGYYTISLAAHIARLQASVIPAGESLMNPQTNAHERQLRAARRSVGRSEDLIALLRKGK